MIDAGFDHRLHGFDGKERSLRAAVEVVELLIRSQNQGVDFANVDRRERFFNALPCHDAI